MGLIAALNDFNDSVLNSTSDLNESIVTAAGQLGSTFGNINSTFDNIDKFFDEDKRQMSTHNIMAGIKNFARNNRFRIVIPTPPTLQSLGYTSEIMKGIMVQCQSVTLPGRSLSTWNYRNVGPVEKMPYDVIFSEITFTFRVDAEYNTRRFFQNWIDSITRKTNNSQNPGFSYKDDYVTDILIFPLDLKGKPIAQFGVKRVFPMSISAIQLDENSSDSITEFSVTMSYKTWQEEPVGSSQSGLTLGPLVNEAVDTFFDSDFANTAASFLSGINGP